MTLPELLAHSENVRGERHLLKSHLEETSRLAASFARHWGGEEYASLAGLLHDVGKASEQFQEYVRGDRDSGGDHSTLGAAIASESSLDFLSFVVAGHHAGLTDRGALRLRVRNMRETEHWRELRRRGEEVVRHLLPREVPELPSELARDPLGIDLLIRMVFGAVVDADFLDTERHFQAKRAPGRDGWAEIDELWDRFHDYHADLVATSADNSVNALRQEVYEACIRAAEGDQGAFSLTVPTGGGKTLSAMAFALTHAAKWGLSRVIVVIPYTSIIEQNADVYRQALGEDAVLEHHSAVDWSELGDDDAERYQIASENWNAPVVVTTSVQFFESLFSNRPGRCRKLHNIPNSIVIIDEVQTVPHGMLEPTMQMLAGLIERYGVTVLLTTATQPHYDSLQESLGGVAIEEVVPDVERIFAQARRVKYTVRTGSSHGGVQWAEVAEWMSSTEQAMTVVNTRKDARELYEEVGGEGSHYLSTDLCGAHRRQVISMVRESLDAGLRCRLVTTQLIEAGVDIDFPLVLRALGPLDRIVQAAGRCNREGRLGSGEVIVFRPAHGGMPPGAYTSGADTAAAMLGTKEAIDLNAPGTYAEYFRRLYDVVNLDKDHIISDRKRLLFGSVARKYRVIPDGTVPVAVAWNAEAEELLLDIESRPEFVGRRDLRDLQPYFVNLYPWQHRQAMQEGLCREMAPGLWRWEGEYDEQVGLSMKPRSEDPIII